MNAVGAIPDGLEHPEGHGFDSRVGLPRFGLVIVWPSG